MRVLVVYRSRILTDCLMRTNLSDLGGPAAPVSVEDTIAGVVNVLEKLTPEDSGAFISATGQRTPW